MAKKRPTTKPPEPERNGPSELGCRAFSVQPQTIDADKRSVEAVLATESAVPMFDYERWETVPEVLLIGGVQLPENRQVPLLNSHARWNVSDVLGSIREFRTSGDKLIGRAYFASAAGDEYEKVREGHVTDMSVGYTVLERTFVPKGVKQNIGGREFEGPVNVATSWRLKEGSLVPIGADELAKLRGYDPQTMRQRREDQQELENMGPELRAFLEARGMPKELTEEQARAWASENKDKSTDEIKPASKVEPVATQLDVQRAINEALELHERKQAEKAKALKDFQEEVRGQCELAGIEDISGRFESPVAYAEVRKHINEERAKGSPPLGHGIGITAGPAQRDKHRHLVGSALNARCVRSCTSNEKTLAAVLPADKLHKDIDQLRYASTFDLATECLRMDGLDIRGLSREQIAICAMGFPEQVGVRAAGDPGAYHVTGSFPQITRDAINKSMMVGYTEAPSTWRGPMRQAASVPDFKTIHRVRLGGVPNIPIWNDNSDPSAVSFADARESYAVEAYSAEVSYSYRLLVNDDMDALSRTPQQLGQAMARTVNKAAWTVVTSNPTMSDSVALFATATGARKRTNLTTGAGAPSVSTLQTLSNLMRQMRGENTPEGNESDDILNIMPRYLIGPTALETTIKQLILSAYDPASSLMVYNTATQLIPVIEPLLDAASTTAWYVFADPSQIDTVEVTFLQGQETPVTRFDTNTKNLSQVYYVLQSFAAAAMNHRGVQKHAGA